MSDSGDINEKDVFIDDLKHDFEKLKLQQKKFPESEKKVLKDKLVPNKI